MKLFFSYESRMVLISVPVSIRAKIIRDDDGSYWDLNRASYVRLWNLLTQNFSPNYQVVTDEENVISVYPIGSMAQSIVNIVLRIVDTNYVFDIQANNPENEAIVVNAIQSFFNELDDQIGGKRRKTRSKKTRKSKKHMRKSKKSKRRSHS
jgi:hypothetical protein